MRGGAEQNPGLDSGKTHRQNQMLQKLHIDPVKLLRLIAAAHPGQMHDRLAAGHH